eukprot:2600904-Rhodomonas_salina.4
MAGVWYRPSVSCCYVLRDVRYRPSVSCYHVLRDVRYRPSVSCYQEKCACERMEASRRDYGPRYAISLPECYAMSGTDLACGTTTSGGWLYGLKLCCYETGFLPSWPGTISAIGLPACYAMSGTDLTMTWQLLANRCGFELGRLYQLQILSAPGTVWCYALSGTSVVYGAMQWVRMRYNLGVWQY